jgi:two-component system sensor histidine kinase KdpD
MVPEIEPDWRGYAWVVLICGAATGLAVALRGTLAEANLVLIYLLTVVLATVRFGRGPGVLASVLAVLAFDIYLVKPYHSLTVADPQYLLTFAFMLAVSLIVSHLTAHLRRQALMAQSGERRASALFGLSKDLSAALTNEQIVEIAEKHLAAAFQMTGRVLTARRDGSLDCAPLAGTPGVEAASARVLAQTIYETQRKGDEADAVTVTGQLHFLPLRAPMRLRGVLVLAGRGRVPADQILLLQTFASQIALAIERVHYVDIARETEIEMESERLRNSLLSAVSHDIRTPLAAIVGLSSTLANGSAIDDATGRDLARAIQDDALRMNGLVTNLLDMARLQTGGVHLNREWQMIEEVIGSALACSARAIGAMDVTVTLAPGLPLVAFDAVLLERVLCNLVENAARYAQAGGWIGIDAAVAGSTLQVAVEDRGPGLAPGSEEALFDKFVRGEAESSREGVGLGLAICRSIVDAHGGRIRAERGMHGGARFVFTLPLGTPPVAPDEGVRP